MATNYTRIIAIGTAVLAGATIGSFQNRIEDHKLTSEQINDYHVHMMSPKLFNIMNKKWQQSPEPMKLQPNLNATELIQCMSQNNINKSLLVSSAYMYTSHTMNYLELSRITSNGLG